MAPAFLFTASYYSSTRKWTTSRPNGLLKLSNDAIELFIHLSCNRIEGCIIAAHDRQHRSGIDCRCRAMLAKLSDKSRE